MGEVFRGQHIGTGGFKKTVAIKRILPQFASRLEFAQMFTKEMNLCARLQHQNIIQVFSNGQHDGYLYLVMEFLHGKSVADLLVICQKRSIRIPPQLSCFIVSEAAQGLHYAHTRIDEQTGEIIPLVHRDISPQNIMLGFEGEVKVVDFGIAAAADVLEELKRGDLKGKLPYTAPEYVKGIQLDHRCDIFGLGVLFHELLAQRPLFASPDAEQTLQNVIGMPIPSLVEEFPDIKFELEGIVAKALEREPDERYQSAEEMYRSLAVFMNRMYPNYTRSDVSSFLKGVFSPTEDPAFQDIQELYGKDKRFSAKIVSAATEIDIPRDDSTPDNRDYGAALPSTFPRILFAIPVLVIIAVFVVAFLMKSKPIASVRPPMEFANILTSYSASGLNSAHGDTITSWTDKSWLQNHAQAAGESTAPRFVASPTPLIEFDGTDDSLTDSGIGEVFRGDSFTIALVATPRGNGTIVSLYGENGNHIGLQALSNGALEAAVTIAGKAQKIEIPPSSTKQLDVYLITLSKETFSISRNNQPGLTITLPSLFPLDGIKTLQIGGDSSAEATKSFFKGGIGELDIYSRALSAEEQRELTMSLAIKFGIKI